MKRFYYQTKEQLDGLRWMARVIEFGVSLSCTVAINELYIGHLALREDRISFCREVKKYANEAVRRADMLRARTLAVMKDRTFYDVYSDTAIDLAEPLVTMLRINIKQILDRGNFKRSKMIADIETARVMLFLAKQQYDSVIEEGGTRWHLPQHILRQWGEFDLGVVLDYWDKVCEILYQGKTIDLNTSEIESVVKRIGVAFGEGEYVETCLAEAKKARPDFFNDFVYVEK